MKTLREMDQLTVAGKTLHSRLIVGTGKYRTFELMRQAISASGSAMVTVAVRRLNLNDKSKESLLDFLPESVNLLPNTAGCFSAEEAIRTARLAQEALQTNLIKLEVLGDEKTLLPDNEALLEATKVLVHEGFQVLPYVTDDPIVAKKLEDLGAAAVMPLAAPIGSGQGILNRLNIQFILEKVRCPVIVDAGVGTASDAAIAMELGVDGILMNTAIAEAKDPVLMAMAMKSAVQAGRQSYLAGRMPKRTYASASSPPANLVTS